MKTTKLQQIILATILLLLSTHFITAQNLCDGHEKPLFGMPEEKFRGRLENGKIYGNPYTLMDRSAFPIANDGFVEIRKAIMSDPTETNIANLYKAIVDIADNTRPASGGGGERENSLLAIWTKCNAFVLLIGIDGTGGEIDRSYFMARVEAGFANMNCDC